MSRVARSARVASRQRVETITATKVLQPAETGETYLINHNAATVIDITLPTPQDGAYFKFIIITDMADNAAGVDIGNTTAGVLQGTVEFMELDGTGHGAEQDAGSATKVTIGVENKTTLAGSYVECVSDGTNWYLNGMVYCENGGTAADHVAFDA